MPTTTNDGYEIKETSPVLRGFVLIVLFALPLTAYMFFASGVHNFSKLPVMTPELSSVDGFVASDGKSLVLKDSITVISFVGDEPFERLGYISNLNEKIYKEFHNFHDFQMVTVFSPGKENEVEDILYQLSSTTDLTDWNFVSADAEAVRRFHESFQADLDLNPDLSSDYAFIIDKDGALRGRDDDEKVGSVYGYDTETIAGLNERMVDDVRVLLSEYRLELKKNRKEKIEDGEK